MRGELRNARRGRASAEGLAAMADRQTQALASAEATAARNQQLRAQLAGQLGQVRAQSDAQQRSLQHAQMMAQQQALQREMEAAANRASVESEFAAMRQRQIDEANAQEEMKRQQWHQAQHAARQEQIQQQQRAQEQQRAAEQLAMQRRQEEERRRAEAQRHQRVAVREARFDAGPVYWYDDTARTVLGTPSRAFGVEVTNLEDVPLRCEYTVEGDQAIHGGSRCVNPSDCVARRSSRGVSIIYPGQTRMVASLSYFQGNGRIRGHCGPASGS